MREYEITMAKKSEIKAYYEGYNMNLKTIEVIVDAESREEAITKVKGYKGMVAVEVDGERV